MGNKGNRHKKFKMSEDRKTARQDIPVANELPQTVSFKKLNMCEIESRTDSDESDFDETSDDELEVSGNGYRLWEWCQLQTLISSSCVCKSCGSSLDLVEDCSNRAGWCSQIGLKCVSPSCSSRVEFISTSPLQEKSADVNTPCVLAMRSIGCGR